MMKKWLLGMLSLVLLFSAFASAMAEPPAVGSLNAVAEEVRGNASFTEESYPAIWITPIFGEYIVAKTNPEDYPANFLTFSPPEGTVLMDFGYDDCTMVDHESLTVYSYYAADRASYELFLEDAQEENILSDGSDGVAIYTNPENGRGYAMLDLKPMFGGTAKLQIIINAYYQELSADALGALIRDEAERVKAEMRLAELDRYWSEGVFSTVTLNAGSAPVSAVIDTESQTVDSLQTHRMQLLSFVKEGTSSKTQIELSDYSYAKYKSEEGDEAASEDTLADGTAFLSYTSDYTGYASFLLVEADKYDRPVYLSIQIDCAPSEFKERLEAMYARISLNTQE